MSDEPFNPIFPKQKNNKGFTPFGGDLVMFGDNIDIEPGDDDFFRATSSVDPLSPMGQGLEMLSELFKKNK